MPTNFRVVIDACVMLPQTLNDLLLTLAEEELFQPIWTAELLDEVERNLVKKFGVAPPSAAYRIRQMRKAFPHAESETEGYRELIGSMKNHRKDRHVLAAAVRSGAALIVTTNLKDFPDQALEPYDIDAEHPDEFLLDQLDLDEHRVLAAIDRMLLRNTRPPRSLLQLADSLRPVTPKFSGLLINRIRSAPPPLEIVADDSFDTFIAQNPPFATPWGTAHYWRLALFSREENAVALARLTVDPQAWGDFDDIETRLTGYTLASGVHDHVERDDVAYVKFVPDSGHSMRAFGDVVYDDYLVLALTRSTDDNLWRAHGLSESWPDSANRIRRPD